MTWARTDRNDYLFKVSEGADGTPFISLESQGKGLRVFEDGHLAFDLKPGTTLKQAEEFARLLNKNIEHISYTAFSDKPPA